jgi:hypothetical protein
VGDNICLRDRLIFALLSKYSVIFHTVFILLSLISVVPTSLFLTDNNLARFFFSHAKTRSY